jgi:hypothetical protein
MARAGGNKSARIGKFPLASITAGILALAPMYPSIKINLDATASRGPAWAVFGISLVLLAAASIHEALECSGVAKKLLCCVLAICFLAGSCGNAIMNISNRSEDSRDDRSSQIEQNQRRSAILAQSSQAREDQAKVAGEATPESITAEIQAAKAKDANRSNATGGCDLPKITAGPSRAFCEGIGQLERKLAAAKKRDELDERIRQIDASAPSKTVQSVDPFADSIADAIETLGYAKVDAAGMKRIAKIWEWTQAILLEMIGSFGPVIAFSILMRMFEFLSGKHGHRAPQSASEKPVKTKPATPLREMESPSQKPSVAFPDADAEIDAFIASSIDFAVGETIKATPLFAAWCAWCQDRSLDAGSQKGFSCRIKKRITHRPGNGRPFYEGVRFKAKDAPRLMVVSG